MTTFTIVTPCFNSAGTIAHCLESVRKQTCSDVEHLCIDGASSDGTVDLLKAAHVRFVSEPDLGIYDAMNKGILLARGEIIGILNSDDRYVDEHVLARVADEFRKGDIDLLHARIVEVDQAGNKVSVLGRDVDFPTLLRRMTVAHPSVFVRRSAYMKYGAFSIGFRIAGDYENLLRLWPKVRTRFLDAVLVEMQRGGASQARPAASYRESAAAAILHGRSPVGAAMDYLVGVTLHYSTRHYLSQLLRHWPLRSRARG